jgi:hypothetical protein
MKLPTDLLLCSLPFLSFTLSLTLQLSLPPHLPTLPSSTHATLATHNLTISAPLRRSNTFQFTNPPSGSYLGEIYCRDYTFQPFRVDVVSESDTVSVWQTFRGNEWDNKGELLGSGVGTVVVEVKSGGEKGYYEGRGGCKCISRDLPEGGSVVGGLY